MELAAAVILGIIAHPSADPVLLDGRCDTAEYAKAETRSLDHGAVLHAMHDQHYVSLCAELPPDSLGTMDLYLQAPEGGPITNLHISAQVGERTYREGEDPQWQWGNQQGWYGPPVAFSGTTLRPDGTARATFADAKGREIRLSKARFGKGPWKMRLELRAIGPNKARIRLPPAEDDWTILRLGELSGQAAAPIVYYLHGKIVEDLGPRGVSPRYGAYDYPGIIESFRDKGIEVISETRAKGTDPSAYADRLLADIRRKLAAGSKPSQITVVGASKGAVIASLVSTRLNVPGVRYVLLANCNQWLAREMKPRLTGEILSIYEASDDVGGTCKPIIDQSPAVSRFEELRLETGLGHGVLYRPLKEWIEPAIAWAKR